MVDKVKTQGPPSNKLKQIESRISGIEAMFPRLLSAVSQGLQSAERQALDRSRSVDLAIAAMMNILGEDKVQAKIDEMAIARSNEAFATNDAEVTRLVNDSHLAQTDVVPQMGVVDLLVSSPRENGEPIVEQVLVNTRNLSPAMFNAVGAKVGDTVPGALPGQTALIRRAFVEVVSEPTTTQEA